MTRNDEQWKTSVWMSLHNLVGHPLSEVVWLAGLATRQQWISDFSVAIHDFILPADAKTASELLNDADGALARFATLIETLHRLINTVTPGGVTIEGRVHDLCCAVEECVRILDDVCAADNDVPASAEYGQHRVAALVGCAQKVRQRVIRLRQEVFAADVELTNVRNALTAAGEPTGGRVIPSARRIASLASSRDIFKFNCEAIKKLFDDRNVAIKGGIVEAVKS